MLGCQPKLQWLVNQISFLARGPISAHQLWRVLWNDEGQATVSKGGLLRRIDRKDGWILTLVIELSYIILYTWTAPKSRAFFRHFSFQGAQKIWGDFLQAQINSQGLIKSSIWLIGSFKAIWRCTEIGVLNPEIIYVCNFSRKFHDIDHLFWGSPMTMETSISSFQLFQPWT